MLPPLMESAPVRPSVAAPVSFTQRPLTSRSAWAPMTRFGSAVVPTAACVPASVMLPPCAVSVPSTVLTLPSLMLPPSSTDRLAPAAMESVSAPLMVIEPRPKDVSLSVE